MIRSTLGGRLADRSIERTLIGGFAIVAAVLVVFANIMHWPLPAAVAILIWGIASFAIVPPLQIKNGSPGGPMVHDAVHQFHR